MNDEWPLLHRSSFLFQPLSSAGAGYIALWPPAPAVFDMKFHYYPETDTLYVELRPEPSVDSQEVSPGIVLDFSSDGRLVGIDVDQAAKNVDLTRLEAVAMPFVAPQ